MELYKNLPLCLQVKIATEYHGGLQFVDGKMIITFEHLYSKIPKVIYKFEDHYEYDEQYLKNELYLSVKRRYYLELNIPKTSKYYYLEYLEETSYSENEVTEEIVEDNDALIVNHYYEWKQPHTSFTKTAIYNHNDNSGYILTIDS
jgi:hypothetical protein